MIPCVLFEDEHLLVVNKPPGMNTHAPSPYAGEGLYEWLRHREPRWASLAIVHRLDKETSGVMVFGKTTLANRSLTEQFARREVRKKYLLITDHAVKKNEFTVNSSLVRAGERYTSRAGGEPAETLFRVIETRGEQTLVEAEPRTGRTHQIRVHAAESGFPILGDTLYGGSPAARVFLHAAELHFKDAATGAARQFTSPDGFNCETISVQNCGNIATIKDTTVSFIVATQSLAMASCSRRLGFIDPVETNAFRLIHGAGDGWPGWQVERLGDYLLSQGELPTTPAQIEALGELLAATGTRGVYHKRLNRQIRQASPTEASPQLVLGEAAPERFEIRENGVRFELSFNEGYSVGLFLDQRDNRRRFLTNHVAANFELTQSAIRNPQSTVLNAFAYTCGFSVCAALGGAHVTSLDLSKKYLEWGKRNFALNGIDPAQHDFIFGDTFDWLRRFAKKGRAFDAIVLDPPTFSQSKESGVFRAEKDYGKLVTAALPVLRPEGVLLASTNAAEWPPEEFVAEVKSAVARAGRRVAQEHYVPQPPDFPITRSEPGYLKTLWARIR